MVASIARIIRIQLVNVYVLPFSPNFILSNCFGEEGISLNPEDPYEFEVPVKRPKLFLYTFIAFIASIIMYVLLVEEPSFGWPQNLIHLLVRH